MATASGELALIALSAKRCGFATPPPLAGFKRGAGDYRQKGISLFYSIYNCFVKNLF
jgi:hypothetical protein